MKKIIPLMLLPIFCYSQEFSGEIETPRDVYKIMYDTINAHLSSYCKYDKISESEKDGSKLTRKAKAANNFAFLKQSKIIFNTVVVGNNDAITNGSAFSYSHDKDKHKFSANMTFASKKWSQVLIDVGTSISNPDDNFSYYSNGKWGDDVALKIGINWRVSTSQFFLDTVCERISRDRYKYSVKKLAEIKEVVNLKISSTELEQKIKNKKDKYYSNLRLDTITSSAEEFAKEITKLDKQLLILKELEFLADPNKFHEDSEEYSQTDEYDESDGTDGDGIADIADTNNKVQKFVNKMMSNFDGKKNPFHGYSIWWLNANVNAANSTFKIKRDSLIIEDVQEKYSSRLKSAIEVSLNMNRIGLRTIQFLKIYGSLGQHSYLDSPNLSGRILEVVPNNPSVIEYYNVIDENGVIVGRYDEIRTWKYSANIGAYYANCFMFDKTLGLTARVNLNAPAFHNQEIVYDKNYSLLGGFIFRAVTEKKWSAATFSVTAGVENQLFDKNGWDRFLVKASVGVPFTIFERAKEEKK